MQHPNSRALRHGGPAGGWGCLSARLGRRMDRLRSGARGRVLTGLQTHAIMACSGAAAMAMASASGYGQPEMPVTRTRTRGPFDFGSPIRRVTDVLLVVNCACFAAQWLTRDALTIWGAKVNAAIFAGQLWRLITPAFLHSGMFHLLINSHALHTIGPHAELICGPTRFAVTYIASALVGTTASVLFTPAPSVGASAAIFGLGAALGVFYWRHREALGRRSSSVLQSLGVTLAINMAYSMMNKRIDNWGHLGGMAGGAAVAFLLGPNLVRGEDGRTVDKPLLPWLAFKSDSMMPPSVR